MLPKLNRRLRSDAGSDYHRPNQREHRHHRGADHGAGDALRRRQLRAAAGNASQLANHQQRIGDASSALDHCLALVELLRARQR
ncbi:hypothetical protein [Pseudomonas alvandae]|uniref:hypothetical protein n=1 Tax=Pseudomonas canavaninivorans TaxID=2842348 RepID=UPI003F58B751